MLDLHHQINETIIIEHQHRLENMRRTAFRTGTPGPVRTAIGRAIIHLGERIKGLEACETSSQLPRQPFASAS